MRNDNDRPDLDDGVMLPFTRKLIFYSVQLLLISYVLLIIYAPIVWAWITGSLFVLGTGLLTTKIVFRIESPALMWFLTPVLGLIWLLSFFLFWLILQALE